MTHQKIIFSDDLTKISIILIHLHQTAIVVLAVVIFFKIFYLFICLEGGDGREKEWERNFSV